MSAWGTEAGLLALHVPCGISNYCCRTLQHGTNDAGFRPGIFSPEELGEARDARAVRGKAREKSRVGNVGVRWRLGSGEIVRVMIRLTTYSFVYTCSLILLERANIDELVIIDGGF